MSWKVNRKSNKVRRPLLGHALLEIANGLRGLGDNLNESLPAVRNIVSVSVDKIILGSGSSRRLLSCINNPHLPPLRPVDELTCEPYELFDPILFRLEPSTDPNIKHGTGLEVDHRGVVFALHGLKHDPQQGYGNFFRQSP